MKTTMIASTSSAAPSRRSDRPYCPALALATTSTGFPTAAWAGRPARSAAWVSSDSSGTSSPAASQASATRMPGPPPLVSTATRRPAGAGWAEITAATSNISSSVAGPDHPCLVEQRLDRRPRQRPSPRCARTPPGARHRYRPAFTATMGLCRADAPGDPGEPAGIGHRLQVGQDEAGAGVLIPVQQQVVGRQVGGVADRHEAADAERRAGEQGERGQPEPAGLGHERQPARRGEGEAEGRIEPGIGSAVEQSHAVGPDEPHPGGAGVAAQFVLQGPALAADLGEPGGNHADRPDPQPAGLVDDPGHQRRGHRHQRQVRRLGARGQVRVGGHPLDDLVAGIDRVHRPGEPAGEQVGQQQGADAGGLVAGPHQGDRRRAEERLDRGPGRRALIGQHGIKVGIGFLHGKAGVHARRRHLLLILQAQLLEQAQHRRIALRHIPGQPPHPGVPGGVGQPAQQQGAQPGAPPARRQRRPGTWPRPLPCAHIASRPPPAPPSRPGKSRRSPPRGRAAERPRHRDGRAADGPGR